MGVEGPCFRAKRPVGAEANHAMFSKPISSSNFQLLSITHP